MSKDSALKAFFMYNSTKGYVLIILFKIYLIITFSLSYRICSVSDEILQF